MITNIFLDIEWNQVNNEILSIGALGCDIKFKPRQNFSAFVRPEHMLDVSDSLISFIHSTREKINSAREISSVMKKFFEDFPDMSVISIMTFIVWTREAFDIFKSNVKELGYELPNYRVVVLQDVLKFINYKYPKCYGMSYFLDVMGLEYDKTRFHDSAYDVDILSDMYMQLRKSILDFFSGDNTVTVLKNRNTNVLHKDSCIYADRVTEGNRERVPVTEILNGYLPCMKCACDKEWQKELFGDFSLGKEKEKKLSSTEIFMPKKLPVNDLEEFCDENIEKTCKEYNLNYRIASGIIYIDTAKGSWMVYHDNCRVLNLFHKNYMFHAAHEKAGKQKAKYHKGYHDQGVKLKTLREACKYICKHDSSPNAYKRKKTRLEELFDIIKCAS